MSIRKSYEEIIDKIRRKTAVVLTAEETSSMARELTPSEIIKKVDIVTTATFGAMCSSGAFLNFGHTTPPMRMERLTLNGVPAHGGLAAVDTYIGATSENPDDYRYWRRQCHPGPCRRKIDRTGSLGKRDRLLST